MALTALTPMVMTAFYNYKGSVERIEASELNNVAAAQGVSPDGYCNRLATAGG